MRYPLVVVVGDMNSKDIGRIAREAGYVWPTDTIPTSNAFGRLDHFFVRLLVMVTPARRRISGPDADLKALLAVNNPLPDENRPFCKRLMTVKDQHNDNANHFRTRRLANSRRVACRELDKN